MTTDARTMEIYATMYEEYVERIAFGRTEPDAHMLRFVEALPAGDGDVLDWGAGTGESASLLHGLGVQVEATDASPQMAAIAGDLGIPVRIETFDALDPEARFRGVWANMSICHASRDVMPGLIALAASALVPGGVLYINVKAGSGERRDRIGRFFSYWNEADLDRITADAGLEKLFAEYFDSISFTQDSELGIMHLSRRPHA